MKKLLVVLLLAACSGDSTSTGPPPSIDGRWFGESAGGDTIGLDIQTTGAQVTGTVTIVPPPFNGFEEWTIVSGTYNHPDLQLTILRSIGQPTFVLDASVTSDTSMLTEPATFPFDEPISFSKTSAPLG